MLTIRRKAMLSDLIKSPNYLSINYFIEKFKISRRTVYYDIEHINKWLFENFSTNIQYSKVAGFFLENISESDVEKIIHDNLERECIKYNAEQRIHRIFLKLFFSQNEVTIFDVQQINNVSKTTAIRDMKQLKTIESISVKVNYLGHYLDNHFEQQHRKFFFKVIQECASAYKYNLKELLDYLSFFVDDIHQLESDILKNLTILADAKINYGLFYTDEIKYLFSIFAAVIKFRISIGKFVNATTPQFDRGNQVAVKILAKKMLKIDDKNELSFFETFLISGQLNGIPLNQVPDAKNNELYLVIKQIVTNFERLSGIYIDDKEKFLLDLYSHIRGTYYRLIYNIPNSNPILSQIKEKYKDIFLFTKLAITPLEKFSEIKISEDEIGYIAIYFGGKIKNVTPLPKRKRIVLICAGGIGTANLISLQLKNEIPEVEILGPYSEMEFKEIRDTLANIDLVVSTISLDMPSKLPYIHTDPFLSENKINEIMNVLGISNSRHKERHYIDGLLDIIGRFAEIREEKSLREQLKTYTFVKKNHNVGVSPVLSELLLDNYIQIIDHTQNWETAIKIAAEPLVNAEKIEPNYVSKMIDDIKKFGPYVVITSGVAIPHSRPENGVNSLAMSLLKINAGVEFFEKGNVKVVIVLATVDNTSHLKALSELSNILSDENKKSEFLSFNKKEQFKQLFKMEEENE